MKKSWIVAGVSAGIAGGALAFWEAGKLLYQDAFKTGRHEPEKGLWLETMPYEDRYLVSPDGLKLHGSLVKQENAKFIFIVIHGYRRSGIEMSYYGQCFYEAFDCHVFLPDLRGHGQSEGNYVGYGYPDHQDIARWVDLLHEEMPDLPIVIFGLSMGGATVNLLSSVEMPNVKLLIEDCGYSNLYDELDFQCHKKTPFGLAPFYPSVAHYIKKDCGYSVNESNGLVHVARAKYPMLFIHGLADDVVPGDMVYDLYNACPTPKELLVMENTGHADAIYDEHERYMEAVARMIEKYA